jgi:hypothetical protein
MFGEFFPAPAREGWCEKIELDLQFIPAKLTKPRMGRGNREGMKSPLAPLML